MGFRILPLLFLFILVSCNQSGGGTVKKADTPDPDGGTPPITDVESLFGKSAAEVLKIKYDSAKVVCGIWESGEGELDLSTAPKITGEIIVTEGTADGPRGADFGNLSTSVSSKAYDMKVLTAMVPTEDGLYQASYILNLKTDFIVRMATDLLNDSSRIESMSEHKEISLNENEQRVIYKGKISKEDDNFMYRVLSCKFETQVKEGFRERPAVLVSPY